MLVGVIQKPSLAEFAATLERLDPGLYDLLELRLDGCTDLSPEGLARRPRPRPVIVTLRAASEGGAFRDGEEARLALLEELIRLEPDYIDLEAAIPAGRIARIRALAPQTRIILSWHDFAATPPSLEGVLDTMRCRASGVIYKMAAQAHSTLDALRMLAFCREQQERDVPLIGISMGPLGSSTRILAPVLHAGFCYCPVDEATAPGQMDARTLRETYRHGALHRDCAIYGLIGDPVAQSRGHLYHNDASTRSGHPGVYVKWQVTREELSAALPLLAAIGVRGLSVTMPHKEAICPLLNGLDEAASAIGAVNTLRLEGQGYYGTNTDDRGALDALGQDVSGARVVMLGAGGAARAVMYEAARRGAHLTVFNRSPKTLPVPGLPRPFSELPLLREQGYDILINALPFDLDFPYEIVPLLPGRLAMDLSYAGESRFARLAAEAGCRLANGYAMFLNQAARQREFWGCDDSGR